MACPVPLSLLCDAAGGATSALAGGVLSAIAGWVVGGATWLLDELGKVITSTTTVNLRASWFMAHYKLMVSVAGVVAVPMLVLASVQAVFLQNASVLLRAAFINLPLAGLLTAAAVQLVQLALEATDALCATVMTGTGDELDNTFHSIGNVLSHEPAPLPTFVMTVGALLIVAGAFLLWLELLVRSAAIYAAVLFLPLALASLVWPAVSHWCKRLTETLVAIVLSKFVVVAVLSLAVGAVTSGNGFSTILAGGALLLLAAFTPFTLLRLIPLVEVGAAMQLEGSRQRVRAAWGRAPNSAVGFALRQAHEHGAHRETSPSPGTPGMPGTGTTVHPGAPGPGSGPSGPSGPSRSLGRLGSLEAPAPSGRPGSPESPGAGDTEGAGGLGEGAREAMGTSSTAGGATAGAVTAGAVTAGATVASRASRLASDGASSAVGQLEALSGDRVSPEWPPPMDLTPPPGTIPLWEGSPESVIAALEATRRPHRVEPDGYGGIIPGVASPLWGGTEPLSRFEPGPKDDWRTWSEDDAPRVQDPPSTAGPQSPGAPPFIDWSREPPYADGRGDASGTDERTPGGRWTGEDADAGWDGE